MEFRHPPIPLIPILLRHVYLIWQPCDIASFCLDRQHVVPELIRNALFTSPAGLGKTARLSGRMEACIYSMQEHAIHIDPSNPHPLTPEPISIIDSESISSAWILDDSDGFCTKRQVQKRILLVYHFANG